MKPPVVDSGQENWSEKGEFARCRHNDCFFFLRKKGEKRMILCRIFKDRVQLKCDSCSQISTFFFDKLKNFHEKVDEPKWIPLSSMIDEWEHANKG